MVIWNSRTYVHVPGAAEDKSACEHQQGENWAFELPKLPIQLLMKKSILFVVSVQHILKDDLKKSPMSFSWLMEKSHKKGEQDDFACHKQS